MGAKNPQIPDRGNRRLRKVWNGVFIGETFGSILRCEQSREFLVLEPNQPDIKVFLLQSNKLSPQEFLVPAGVQRELIIRKDIGTLLGLAEVIQHNYWDLLQLQLSGGQQTAVPRDDTGFRVNQDGLLNPKAAMLAAIWATCASECVLGFRANGISLSSAQCSMRFTNG